MTEELKQVVAKALDTFRALGVMEETPEYKTYEKICDEIEKIEVLENLEEKKLEKAAAWVSLQNTAEWVVYSKKLNISQAHISSN